MIRTLQLKKKQAYRRTLTSVGPKKTNKENKVSNIFINTSVTQIMRKVHYGVGTLRVQKI